MTLQDALVAYKTYARAEGKSPKTVTWVASGVGYFAQFLGPGQQDTDAITANDLRRFIIALQGVDQGSPVTPITNRSRLLIRLLFHLGCRVSEALALQVSDIDLERATVTILHLKTRIRLSCPMCKAR